MRTRYQRYMKAAERLHFLFNPYTGEYELAEVKRKRRKRKTQGGHTKHDRTNTGS